MLLGLIFLVIGYGGAGLQDWRTMFVSDRWLIPLILGIGIYLWPSSSLFQIYSGCLFGVFAITGWKFGQLGSGDLVPLMTLGFVLGLWAFVAFSISTAMLIVYNTRKKVEEGPAVAFMALGFGIALIASSL